MKIGLLTLPLETGYGSIMQALALNSALVKFGHDVILIRRLRNKKRYPVWRIFRRIVKKFILFRLDTIVLIDKKEMDEYPIITRYVQPFIDKYLQPFSPIYTTTKEFKQVEKLNLDAIVVGSDQVWRPGCMDNIEDFFLYQISDDIRKYSYAASLGVDNWRFTKSQTETCRKAVQKFLKTSVREKSSVSMCERNLGITPDFVLDPTLLFDQTFYTQFIEEHDETRNGKICAFILDRTKDKNDLLLNVCKHKKREFYYASNNTEDKTVALKDRIAPSISSWLDAFNSAEFVVTDSFHGCVFSIIFQKNFYVYINKGRGTERFYSLLGMLGLKDHIVDVLSNIDKIPNIDWTIVNGRLEEMRKKSWNFISEIK